MNDTETLLQAIVNAADAFEFFKGTGFLACNVKDPAAPDTVPAILVGFSGGADSVALLHALKHLYGEAVYALHVHHGIRGEEADRDLAFCRELAASLQVPFFEAHVDTPGEKKPGESLEEAARRLRYAAFQDCAAAHGIPLIATAHHADDHLETILFHLIRGSGPRGLCGIPPKRDNIIRPLIGCDKDLILRYCAVHQLPFVTDSTNDDIAYSRNYLRARVIPCLKQLNPKATEAAARTAAALRADNHLLEELAASYYEETALATLQALPKPLLSRVVLEKLRRLTPHIMPQAQHIDAVVQLITEGTSGGRRSLPGNFSAVCRSGQLLFSHTERRKTAKATPAPLQLSLPKPGEELFFPLFSGDWALLMVQDETKIDQTEKYKKRFQNIYKLFIHHIINFDKINGNLFLRQRRPGDRLICGGMNKALGTLSCAAAKGDFPRPLPPVSLREPLMLLYSDPAERKTLPLLCDGDGILILPGIAARDGITPATGSALHIYLFKK